MADHKLDLPFWEGFTVTELERTPGVTRITLLPEVGNSARCSGCGQRSERVHEQGWRTIRDLPILGDAVWLRVRLRRVRCADCGPRTERVSWLDRHARITRRLAEFVGHWCEKLPVAHVCQLSGLHWETVRRIDTRRLQARLDALPEARPSRLVMDEFALYKGHRYATVVMDADTRRVLWVGEGRSREAIRPFFDWLGVERCKEIEAVAMDMNIVHAVACDRNHMTLPAQALDDGKLLQGFCTREYVRSGYADQRQQYAVDGKRSGYQSAWRGSRG